MRVCTLLVLVALAAPALAQDLGSLAYQAPSKNLPLPGGEAGVYKNSYAVVIGISDYENLPDLPGAVHDARNVAETLEQDHHFDVRLILDQEATRTRITAELGDRLLPMLEYGDRVLIYFAGHGVTVGDGDAAMGYLMPVEGDNERRMATGIAMSELQRIFALYPSKHVMFVADACYSGLALSTRSVGLPTTLEDYLRQVTQKRVRLALTAGRADQEAHEWQGQGLFTYFFVEALKGHGDSNGDRILTSSELYAYLEPSVAQTALSNWQARQNPQLGRSGEGEFIFLVPGRDIDPDSPAPATKAPSPELAETAEITFWKSIESSSHPEDFELFLERFPSGLFAELARLRLDRLDSQPEIDRVDAPAEPLVTAAEAAPEPDRPGPGQPVEHEVVERADEPEAAPPAKGARVFGRPSSPQEAEAWKSIETADGIESQRAAAEKLIEQFPEGGLVPYAHYVLASIYRRASEVSNFVLHSEQALESGLPFPELSGYLALVYSESGRIREAEQTALETLNAAGRIGRRTGETEAEWTMRKDQIAADASYALGRVYLDRSARSEGTDGQQLLEQSVKRLEQAVEYSPHHQYAAFRLGEAMLREGKGEASLQWFARAAALGGELGDIAAGRLSELGSRFGRSGEDLEELRQTELVKVQQALSLRASNLGTREKKEMRPPSLFRNRPDEKKPD